MRNIKNIEFVPSPRDLSGHSISSIRSLTISSSSSSYHLYLPRLSCDQLMIDSSYHSVILCVSPRFSGSRELVRHDSLLSYTPSRYRSRGLPQSPSHISSSHLSRDSLVLRSSYFSRHRYRSHSRSSYFSSSRHSTLRGMTDSGYRSRNISRDFSRNI
jgi:hypothetical protein